MIQVFTAWREAMIRGLFQSFYVVRVIVPPLHGLDDCGVRRANLSEQDAGRQRLYGVFRVIRSLHFGVGQLWCSRKLPRWPLTSRSGH